MVDPWRPRDVSPAPPRKPREAAGRPRKPRDRQARAGIPAAVSRTRRRGGCLPARLRLCPRGQRVGRPLAICRELKMGRNPGPVPYRAVKNLNGLQNLHAQTGCLREVGGSGPGGDVGCQTSAWAGAALTDRCAATRDGGGTWTHGPRGRPGAASQGTGTVAGGAGGHASVFSDDCQIVAWGCRWFGSFSFLPGWLGRV